MTVTYQVIISDPVLQDPEVWDQVEGLRLVSVDAPWVPAGMNPGQSIMKLCTVEDDGAPEALAGKIVDLTLTRDTSGAGVRVLVDSRTVVG